MNRYILAAFLAVLLTAPAVQAVTFDTIVDETARTVTLSFTSLPPYEQIALEGAIGIPVAGPIVSAGLASSSITPTLTTLSYDPGPPADNSIVYGFEPGMVFDGFATAEWWVVLSNPGSTDLAMSGNQPMFVVGEPSSGLLASLGLLGLVVFGRRGRLIPAATH